MSDFLCISNNVVKEMLSNPEINIQIVEKAYNDYSTGKAVCPESVFLRFPWEGKDRIIGLPAYLKEPESIGIKWTSSFPQNRTLGKQRASAVVILNDTKTGYPVACIEGALISAVRTAAFATLATKNVLTEKPLKIGVIGAGFISKNIIEHIIGMNMFPEILSFYDIDRNQSSRCKDFFSEKFQGEIELSETVRDVSNNADLIILATDAIAPHINEIGLFKPNSLILHISLRDFSSEIMKNCINVTDNIKHAIREGTSLGNAYNKYGKEKMQIYRLHEILHNEEIKKIIGKKTKPIIFSPFGLGVLDIAMAQYVYDSAKLSGLGQEIHNFFGN